MKMRQRISIPNSSGLLLLIATLLGCSFNVTSVSSPDALGLTSRDFIIKINAHYWDESQDVEISNHQLQPTKINKLVVDMTVTNQSNANVDLACFAVDGERNTYAKVALNNIPLEDSFWIAYLGPRVTRRGKMGFKVPYGNQALWLQCGKNIVVKIQ
jgi:hypothetical protein